MTRSTNFCRAAWLKPLVTTHGLPPNTLILRTLVTLHILLQHRWSTSKIRARENAANLDALYVDVLGALQLTTKLKPGVVMQTETRSGSGKLNESTPYPQRVVSITVFAASVVERRAGLSCMVRHFEPTRKHQ